ncbi:universal stress protein [Deinococcus planocerae]|uniref:universal stress protein n=1 Tax=Deinococcus planocerae TaxID=1737569 RepID=UPI000C7F2FF4|nr:universal stress protein [Deinococcus planocerae]
MIKRVLVPLETVDAAHPALRAAQANFPEARVCPLHVLPVGPTGAEFVLAAVPARAYEEARTRLNALGGGELLSGGDPAGEILRRAGSGIIDLIVMGTGGKRGLPRLLLGSVAERVVRESPVPVLTVRTGEPGMGGSFAGFRRLLVLTDFSPAAHRAHDFAREAFPAAQMEVLHVVSAGSLQTPVPLTPAGRAVNAAALVARNQEWRREARHRLRELGGGELVEGDPADVALGRAWSGKYDALVLGTAAKTGLERLLFGSVAGRVVRESPIPVLTAGEPTLRRTP